MSPSSLEEFWEEILSRQPARISTVYTSISIDEKESVLDHLHKMASEPGWHAEQRISAQAALDELKPTDDSTNEDQKY